MPAFDGLFCSFLHKKQRCAYSGCQVDQGTKVCGEAPKIFGCLVWNLLHVNNLESIILRWFLDIRSICAPWYKAQNIFQMKVGTVPISVMSSFLQAVQNATRALPSACFNQPNLLYYRNYFQSLISFISFFALVFHSFLLWFQNFLNFLLHVAIISCFCCVTSRISARYINIGLKLTHNILSFL